MGGTYDDTFETLVEISKGLEMELIKDEKSKRLCLECNIGGTSHRLFREFYLNKSSFCTFFVKIALIF